MGPVRNNNRQAKIIDNVNNPIKFPLLDRYIANTGYETRYRRRHSTTLNSCKSGRLGWTLNDLSFMDDGTFLRRSLNDDVIAITSRYPARESHALVRRVVAILKPSVKEGVWYIGGEKRRCDGC